MTIQTRSGHPKALIEGIEYVKSSMERDRDGEWEGLFTEVKTKKAFQEMVLSHGFGTAAEVGEGAEVPADAGGEAYNQIFRPIKVGIRVEVTEEAVEDNLYEDVGKAEAKHAMRALKNTKAIYAASVFNDAFTVACADGQYLLDTDHPLGRGGTFANKLAVAADLTETSLDDIRVLIRTNKNDSGIYETLKAQKLVVPPQLTTRAVRLLMSGQRPGTNDNDINWIKSEGLFPGGIHEMTRLTSATAWYVTTDAENGLIYVNRRGVETTYDRNPLNGNYLTRMTERYLFSSFNPRGLFGSEGV